MTIKAITRSISALTSAMLLVTATAAGATTYDITFTDVISSATTPGISVGDPFVLTIFADNGGSSDIDQTYNLTDFHGFTITAGSYHASYSSVFPNPMHGNITTDAFGHVASVIFVGTSNTSKNVDNFGSFTGDYVSGNGILKDSLGNYDEIQAGGYDFPAQYTISVAGAPEPSTWSLMIAGVGLIGAALRFSRRKGSTAIA